MECPECGGMGLCYATKTFSTARQRYRRCRECHYRWSSWEEREMRKIRTYKRKQSLPRPEDHSREAPTS